LHRSLVGNILPNVDVVTRSKSWCLIPSVGVSK
jgi:hypothetical protein